MPGILLMVRKRIVTIPKSAVIMGLVASGAMAQQNDTTFSLRPAEYVVRFTDGCQAIFDIAMNDELATTFRASRWYGACRFGFVDGTGIIGSGNNFTRRTFRYGKMVFGPLGDRAAAVRSFTPTFRFLRIGLGAPVHPEASLRFYRPIERIEKSTTSWKIDRVEIANFKCKDLNARISGGGYARISGYALDANTQRKVASTCRGFSEVEILLLLRLQAVKAVGPSGTIDRGGLDADPSNPNNFIRACPNFGTLNCMTAWNSIIAPFRVEYDALKPQEAAMNQAVLDDMTARFAPLEATLRKQIADFVARQARPAKLVPTPVARPVLKKGVRK